MWAKQCHKPPMTGNGLYIPPIKKSCLGDDELLFYPHYLGYLNHLLQDDDAHICTQLYTYIYNSAWGTFHPSPMRAKPPGRPSFIYDINPCFNITLSDKLRAVTKAMSPIETGCPFIFLSYKFIIRSGLSSSAIYVQH